MPIYVEKNMRYMHFAEICEKCGNIQNMWQSHIRIKLTCLTNVLWSVCVCVLVCVFECWSRMWAVLMRLNWSRCCLGYGLIWTKKHVLDGGQDAPGEGSVFLGGDVVDIVTAVSALALLVGCQEEHPEQWGVGVVMSGARCRLIAYGPADATASQNPIISCLI